MYDSRDDPRDMSQDDLHQLALGLPDRTKPPYDWAPEDQDVAAEVVERWIGMVTRAQKQAARENMASWPGIDPVAEDLTSYRTGK